MPNQRDIVLIPVPFTDLTSTKRRPVIVISNDAYNHTTEDMVVVAMTSNPADVPHSFRIAPRDLESGKLNRPSKVRVDKIFALSQSIAAITATDLLAFPGADAYGPSTLVSFSSWFGWPPLPHKPAAQGRLTFPHISEKCIDVMVVLRR